MSIKKRQYIVSTSTPKHTEKKQWYVYMLVCADGTLYTGITTDLKRRVMEHNSGPKGAKYTRARQPVRLVFHEHAANRQVASQKEYALRKLPRKDKLRLVAEFTNKVNILE